MPAGAVASPGAPVAAPWSTATAATTGNTTSAILTASAPQDRRPRASQVIHIRSHIHLHHPRRRLVGVNGEIKQGGIVSDTNLRAWKDPLHGRRGRPRLSSAAFAASCQIQYECHSSNDWGVKLRGKKIDRQLRYATTAESTETGTTPQEYLREIHTQKPQAKEIQGSR